MTDTNNIAGVTISKNGMAIGLTLEQAKSLVAELENRL